MSYILIFIRDILLYTIYFLAFIGSYVRIPVDFFFDLIIDLFKNWWVVLEWKEVKSKHTFWEKVFWIFCIIFYEVCMIVMWLFIIRASCYHFFWDADNFFFERGIARMKELEEFAKEKEYAAYEAAIIAEINPPEEVEYYSEVMDRRQNPEKFMKKMHRPESIARMEEMRALGEQFKKFDEQIRRANDLAAGRRF